MPADRPRITHWMGIAFACVAVLLYANTLQHGYALDDFPTIYGNRLTMSGVKGIPTLLHTAYWYGFDGQNDWLYRPLSMVMFAIEWQLAPNTPALGHWINVLVYALSAVVLFRFLRELFDTFHIAVPLAVSLLWIAHPIHTEVVANIKSRDELLAFLFSILTIRECVRYVKAPHRHQLTLAGCYFFLALLAKESPITLIAIVPLTLFVFTRADAARLGRVMVPIAIAAATYLAIRSSVLTSQIGGGAISLIDNSLVAAPDFAHREATAFYIAAKYLALLFLPHPMSSDYSFRQIPIVGFDNPIAIGSLILHVALGVFAVMRLTRKDPVGYGILFYLVGMSLVANVLFLTRSTMADRFLFMPSLGFCIVVVVVLARLLAVDVRSRAHDAAVPEPSSLSKPFAMLIGCVLIAYTLQTWARNPDWENDTTIFAADATHSPNSARVHFLNGNHALQELKQGKVPVSLQRQLYFLVMKEFRRAIELYPAYAEPHVGIGEAYTLGGDFPAAIDWYRRIVTRNPRYGVGHRLLGNAFFATQQYDSAIVHLKRSIAEDPSQADAHNAYALGLSYQAKGDLESARSFLDKAYALDPSLKK